MGFNAGLMSIYRHKYMMKKTLMLVAFTAMAVTGASAQMLVINEVYSGGGSSGTTAPTAAYTRDFVEIYNPSATPFSLTGYALQYASATGNFTGTILSFGAGSIIGGNDYLTISTGTAGTAGATLAAGTGQGNATYVNANGSSLAAGNGSVRLVNLSTSIVIDLVGYGTLTVGSAGDPKSEGAAAATPTSIAVSLNRTNFVDTNVNSADFSSMAPSPNAGTASFVVPATVPEPSTWAFIIGGFGALCQFTRRRNVA